MLSAARSLSPLKSSPSLMFKTPSLLNINLEDDSKDASKDDSKDASKDARIRELEETIAALRSELASVRTLENKREGEEEEVPTQPRDMREHCNTNGDDDQDNTHDNDAIDDGMVTEDTINGTIESPDPHIE